MEELEKRISHIHTKSEPFQSSSNLKEFLENQQRKTVPKPIPYSFAPNSPTEETKKVVETAKRRLDPNYRNYSVLSKVV